MLLWVKYALITFELMEDTLEKEKRQMTIQRITACVQVKGDYQKCYHFYTEKVGLVPTYGDESGPYTSFASKKEEAPFFGMFQVDAVIDQMEGYPISDNRISSDTLSATFHTTDFEEDYTRMKNAGVVFEVSKTVLGEGDQAFHIAYFRDPEGNLLSLEDGGV